MNNKEAKQILKKELEGYRDKPYAELIKMIHQPTCYDVTTENETRYQIEIQSIWDGPAGGDVRVMGSVDDGGWRSFVPLTLDFIKTQDNKIIDD